MNKKFLVVFLCALIISLVVFWDYFKYGVNRNPYGDTLVDFFPMRYFISSSIRHGIFPLWDHWTHGGMSTSTGIGFFASPFSPIILFFSLFGVYNLNTMKIEMLVIQIFCFIGMFFWVKSFTNKWIAIFGAFSFSLSSQILGVLNSSIALVSMSFIPSVAYSIKRILRGSFQHIGFLSLILFFIFTTGYLGLNLFFGIMIPIYCLIEYILLNQELYWFELIKSLSRRIGFLIIAIILFLGITNFSWIESWYYTSFNYSQFRSAIIYDPFYGSAYLDLLYTTVFPNLLPLFPHPFEESNINVFISKYHLMPAAGVMGTIYFGMINLIFIFFALFARNTNRKDRRIIILLTIFITLTFCFSLSNNYLLTKFLSKIFPVLNLTRWHSWFNSLTIFFAVSLACIGLKKLYEFKNYQDSIKTLMYITLVMMVFVIFTTVFFLPLNSYIYLPQIIILFVILGLLILFNKSKFGIKRKKNLSLYLALIAGIEIFIQSGNYVVYRNFEDEPRKVPGIVEKYKKFAQNNFPLIANKRIHAKYNLQLVNKIPSDDVYINLMNPKIFNLEQNFGKEEYGKLMEKIFYFSDSNNRPIEFPESSIKIKKFLPNEVEVTVKNPQENQTFVWSSPYTPFWKLKINGEGKGTEENKFGLTKVSLNKGNNDLILKYQPFYLVPSIVIMIFSLLVSIILISKGLLHKKIK